MKNKINNLRFYLVSIFGEDKVSKVESNNFKGFSSKEYQESFKVNKNIELCLIKQIDVYGNKNFSFVIYKNGKQIKSLFIEDLDYFMFDVKEFLHNKMNLPRA